MVSRVQKTEDRVAGGQKECGTWGEDVPSPDPPHWWNFQVKMPFLSPKNYLWSETGGGGIVDPLEREDVKRAREMKI